MDIKRIVNLGAQVVEELDGGEVAQIDGDLWIACGEMRDLDRPMVRLKDGLLQRFSCDRPVKPISGCFVEGGTNGGA